MIKGQWNFLNAIFLGRAVSATDKIFIELLSCFRLRQKGSQMEIVPDHFCHFVLFLLFIHQHAHRLQPQQLKCQDIIQLLGCSAMLWRLEKKKCHSPSLLTDKVIYLAVLGSLKSTIRMNARWKKFQTILPLPAQTPLSLSEECTKSNLFSPGRRFPLKLQTFCFQQLWYSFQTVNFCSAISVKL